jgi:hypothetical protein
MHPDLTRDWAILRPSSDTRTTIPTLSNWEEGFISALVGLSKLQADSPYHLIEVCLLTMTTRLWADSSFSHGRTVIYRGRAHNI